MSHQGSCHCGRVAFTLEGDIDAVIDCNCSLCRRRGGLLWFVPREALVLKTPEGDLSTYTFNKHAIRHRFCKRCGMHPYAEGAMPDGSPIAAINIRCLEGIDLGVVPVNHYDGRAL